jgi:hypothetical protein
MSAAKQYFIFHLTDRIIQQCIHLETPCKSFCNSRQEHKASVSVVLGETAALSSRIKTNQFAFVSHIQERAL